MAQVLDLADRVAFNFENLDVLHRFHVLDFDDFVLIQNQSFQFFQGLQIFQSLDLVVLKVEENQVREM